MQSEKYFAKQNVRVAAVPEGHFLIPQRTEAGNNDNNFYYRNNNNISYRISWDALCPHRNARNPIVLMFDSEYVCQETSASLQQPRLPD